MKPFPKYMKPFTSEWWFEMFEICAFEVRAHAFTVALHESDSEIADDLRSDLCKFENLLHFTAKRYAIAYHREQSKIESK